MIRIRRQGFVIYTVLYVSIVSLIPLISGTTKGSITNTLIKFFVFIIFFCAALKHSNYNLHTSVFKLSIVLLYTMSQLMCVLISGSLNYVSSIVEIGLLIILMVSLSNILEDDCDICRGIKLYLFFDVFSIVYNIFTNIEKIVSLSFIRNVDYTMYSFFDNKNTYGMILFVGLVLIYYLKALNPDYRKGFVNVLLVAQIVAIMMTLCRTALLCTGVFLTFYYLRNFSRKRLCIVSMCFIAVVILMVIPSTKNFILYHLLRIDVGTYRENIYEGALILIKKSFLYGYGEDNYGSLLAGITGNIFAHNGFYTILLDGGILYLIAYIIAYIIFFKQAFLIKIANKELGLAIIGFLISTIVYSLFEGIVVLGSSASNMAFCLAVCIIPTIYNNTLSIKTRCDDSQM